MTPVSAVQERGGSVAVIAQLSFRNAVQRYNKKSDPKIKRAAFQIEIKQKSNTGKISRQTNQTGSKIVCKILIGILAHSREMRFKSLINFRLAVTMKILVTDRHSGSAHFVLRYSYDRC